MRRFWKDRWSPPTRATPAKQTNKRNLDNFDTNWSCTRSKAAWILFLWDGQQCCEWAKSLSIPKRFKCLLAKESPSTLPVNLLASKLCSSTIFLCELKNFRTVAGSMWLCAEATHLLPYCQGVVKVFDSRQLCSKSHAHSSFGRRKHITCSSLVDVVRAIGTRQVAGRYNLNTMKVQVFRRLFGTNKSGSSSIPPVNSETHRYLWYLIYIYIFVHITICINLYIYTYIYLYVSSDKIRIHKPEEFGHVWDDYI